VSSKVCHPIAIEAGPQLLALQRLGTDAACSIFTSGKREGTNDNADLNLPLLSPSTYILEAEVFQGK